MNKPFLKNIITGDEKWAFYDNLQRKRQWTDKDEPPQLNPKGSWMKNYAVCMVGLLQYYSICVFQAIIKHSMLTYSQQLQCVHENLMRKRPTLHKRRNVVLLHITQGHIHQGSDLGLFFLLIHHIH